MDRLLTVVSFPHLQFISYCRYLSERTDLSPWWHILEKLQVLVDCRWSTTDLWHPTAECFFYFAGFLKSFMNFLLTNVPCEILTSWYSYDFELRIGNLHYLNLHSDGTANNWWRSRYRERSRQSDDGTWVAEGILMKAPAISLCWSPPGGQGT